MMWARPLRALVRGQAPRPHQAYLHILTRCFDSMTSTLIQQHPLHRQQALDIGQVPMYFMRQRRAGHERHHLFEVGGGGTNRR